MRVSGSSSHQANLVNQKKKSLNSANPINAGLVASNKNQLEAIRLMGLASKGYLAGQIKFAGSEAKETPAIQMANDILSCTKEAVRLSKKELVEEALKNDEGKLSETGALVVETGKYTGRAANDKFIVDTPGVRNEVNWGKVNVPISEEKFDQVLDKFKKHLADKKVYVFDGLAGADKKYTMPVRFINELASQNLFTQHVFIHPTKDEQKNLVPEFTVIAAPGLKLDPKTDGVNSEAGILINFDKRTVLIAGTQYAGEIKKSIFSVLNYMLPQKGMLTMHCSANVGPDGDTALFYGLSGTGKTTLSADPNRGIIGDDEHVWTDKGIFNIEGGCYAKCINLSKENEPQIWNAIKDGALVENVPMFPSSKTLDFDNASIPAGKKGVENTRAAYPVSFIDNAVIPSIGSHPKTIVFLTADASGVLPPVAKLEGDQIKYYLMSGYTSKLAGTELGVKEPVATFSSCFGEPFLPLHPSKYADMLVDKVKEHGTKVYLVNTGWAGGPYGVGKRISIPNTRAIVNAALSGDLSKVEYERHPVFNIMIPKSCPGVDSKILNPRESWTDTAAYDKSANELAQKFVKNFKKYNTPEIAKSGPKVQVES